MDCGPLHRFTVVSPEGKLFLAHNCDQAMCRDILGAGMLAADAAGFDLRGSVHDEIIALRKAGDARYSHERLGECMTRRLPWLPADAPIGSDGFTDVVYRK